MLTSLSAYNRGVGWLLILMLAWPLGASAQATKKRKTAAPPKRAAAAPAVTTFPIVSLAVEGNRYFTAAQVLAAAGLRIGQTADKVAFEAARDRLVASGYFDSVGYRFVPSPEKTGYAASFQVTEVNAMFPWRSEDLPITAAELANLLARADPLFGARIPGAQPVLARYVKSIEDFLARNQHKEKVIAKMAAGDGPGELIVVFRPDRLPPAVAEVLFLQNKAISEGELRTAIGGVAIGTRYSEARLRQLLDTSVRPRYEARGHIRVSFPKIEVQPSQAVTGLVVTVTVEEGEPFKLGEVAFRGGGLPIEQLRKAGDFKTGETANFQAIEAGVERIRQALRRGGFMQVKASTARRTDDAAKIVNLTLEIEPGARFSFRRLIVEGLDIQTEPVVRKMWAIKEGDPFNPEYPPFFLNRMREDGIFEDLGDTKSTLRIDETVHAVDVTLAFGKAASSKPLLKSATP